jgi:hypothetical protein
MSGLGPVDGADELPVENSIRIVHRGIEAGD